MQTTLTETEHRCDPSDNDQDILLAISVITGVLGTATTASAAEFAMKTSAFNLDGYAGAQGTVTFVDTNTIRISSQVADHCGAGTGDGEGAYLWAEITYVDGSVDGGHTISINWDDDGCDNGTKPAITTTLNPGRAIKKVRMRLDEADGPSNPSETVYSPWMDNPVT